jgi:hypothetical protein
MAMIPPKVAPHDFATTKPTACALRSCFSRLLGAVMETYLRQEYREIARYQHLTGRQLADNAALDTEQRTPPII